MDRNFDLDFLASCISWIEDEDKRNAAVRLCDGHYQKCDDYDPDKFREVLEKKLKLNDEFDFVISNPGVKEMYCTECREFSEVPVYALGEEDLAFECDSCDNQLVPVTKSIEDQERIEDAIDVVGDLSLAKPFFNSAFLGVSQVPESEEEFFAIYDGDKCIQIIADREAKSFEDAAAKVSKMIENLTEDDYVFVFKDAIPLVF